MTTQSPSVEIKVLLKRPMILLIVAVIFVFSLIGANIADRAFLAGLAMTCKLHRYGETQSEVVTCLRTAAADPSAILPNSVSQADAHDKLERMLDYAPGATSSGS